MKQLLIILALMLVFASCDTKLVENPKAETTLEMQQQPKDTMLVVMEQDDSRVDRIELYDMNNQVVYKKDQLDGWTIFGLLLAGFWIGMPLMLLLFSSFD